MKNAYFKENLTHPLAMSHGHSHGGAPCQGHHDDDGAGGSRQANHDVNAVGLLSTCSHQSLKSFQLVEQLRLAGVDVAHLPNIPSAPRDMSEAKNKNFQFWSTQPVPQMGKKMGIIRKKN